MSVGDGGHGRFSWRGAGRVTSLAGRSTVAVVLHVERYADRAVSVDAAEPGDCRRCSDVTDGREPRWLDDAEQRRLARLPARQPAARGGPRPRPAAHGGAARAEYEIDLDARPSAPSRRLRMSELADLRRAVAQPAHPHRRPAGEARLGRAASPAPDDRRGVELRPHRRGGDRCRRWPARIAPACQRRDACRERSRPGRADAIGDPAHESADRAWPSRGRCRSVRPRPAVEPPTAPRDGAPARPTGVGDRLATMPGHDAHYPDDAPASAGAVRRARRAVTPGGVNSPVRAFRAVGGTPAVHGRAAAGPWLTDVDGREYVDLVCSWGPMILGHAHPEVRRGGARGGRRAGFVVRHARPSPRSRSPRRSSPASRRSSRCAWSPRGTEATMSADPAGPRVHRPRPWS